MNESKSLIFVLFVVFTFFLFPVECLCFDLTEADTDGSDIHGDALVLKGWNINSGDDLTYVLVDANTPPGIDSTDWTNAVTDSFQVWEDVSDCYVAFAYATGTGVMDGKIELTSSQSPSSYYSQRAPDQGSNPPHNAGTYNVISCITKWSDFFPVSDTALAITATLYYPSTRYIAAADMFLNCEGDFDWTTTNEPGHYDVQNVITHEVGHFIGIGHPANSNRLYSTMWFQAPPGEVSKRDLDPDDEHAAIYLYPENMTLVTTPAVIPPDNNIWGLRDPDTGLWTDTAPSGGIPPVYTEGSGGGGGCTLTNMETDNKAFFIPWLMLFFIILVFRSLSLSRKPKLEPQRVRVISIKDCINVDKKDSKFV